MAAAVVVENLRKTYGSLAAVDGLSLTIEPHEVVALLGPNGAGKTTTVEILEGYRTPDAGSVSVLGMNPLTGGRAFRERIGVVLQEAGFEDQFSPRELLRLHAGYYPHPRPVDEVLALVGLEEKADAKVRTLSGGQRRRLDLGLGLVGDPEMLFLDEPTTGFDPSARRRAWDLVDRLRDLGTTILLTTHYLDEAQHLADRVVVIDHGRIIAEGTPDALAAAAGTGVVVSFRLPATAAVGDLPQVGDDVRVAGTIVEVRTTQPTADVHALAGWAMARGVELEGLSVARPSLEDVYLDLVGETDLAPVADLDAAPVADLAATPDAAPAATPGAGPAATRAASPAVTGADPAPDPRTGDTPDGGARR
jgi:ABC-2 type transport system ATP-binding protein